MWDLGDGTAPAPGTTATPADGGFVSEATALVGSLGPLATTIMTGLDQQKLLDYNLKLIAAGKQPLTADQLAALQSASSPAVALGLSSETQTLVKDALIGAAVLGGGFLLVKMLTEKSRR